AHMNAQEICEFQRQAVRYRHILDVESGYRMMGRQYHHEGATSAWRAFSQGGASIGHNSRHHTNCSHSRHWYNSHSSWTLNLSSIRPNCSTICTTTSNHGTSTCHIECNTHHHNKCYGHGSIAPPPTGYATDDEAHGQSPARGGPQQQET
ncbi:hypothetical protein NDU88_004733, partial [Pleurodeles waltl]